MIYSLQGKLLIMENNYIVIQCSGVGYKCLTSSYTQGQFHDKIGQEVVAYTYMSVRQDAVDLFGFSSLNELNCFKLLTTVSGVGPKAALSILSQFSAEKVSMLVSAGDSKSLTNVSGIGSKTAQRIVLELKDKLTGNVLRSESTTTTILPSCQKNISEAVKALSTLGYSGTEVLPVLSKLDSNLSVEQLIQQTLKAMAKGV